MQGRERDVHGEPTPPRGDDGATQFPPSLDDLDPPSGVIVWLGELPDHSVVVDGSNSDLPGVTEVVLAVRPLPANAQPEPPDEIRPWLPEDLSDPDQPPEPLDAIAATGAATPGDLPPPPELLVDHPDVAAAVADWLPFWQLWALAERQDRPARALHEQLEAAADLVSSADSGVEIVLGLGLLSWAPLGAPPIQRHLFTTALTTERDRVSGEMRLLPTDPGITLEIEMLERIEVHAAAEVERIAAAAAAYRGAATARSNVESMIQQLAVSLAPGAAYRPTHDRPNPGPDPVVTWAPALILRRPQNVIDLRAPAAVANPPMPEWLSQLPPPPSDAVIDRMRDLAAETRAPAPSVPDHVNDLTSALVEEEGLLVELEELRRERALIRDEFARTRAVEAPPHLLPYAGSRARIAERLAAEAADFAWIAGARVAPGSSPPVADAHMQHWVMLRSDERIKDEEADAMGELLHAERIPTVESFRAVVDEEERTHAQADRYGPPISAVGRALLTMSPASLATVRSNLVEVSSGLGGVDVSERGWAQAAVQDIRAGLAEPWIKRRVSVTALVTQAEEQLRAVGVHDAVRCSGSPQDLLAPARLLLDWLEDGNTVRVGDDGRPRKRVRVPKQVLDAASVLEQVRVNGAPPADASKLRSFLAWGRASTVIDQLESLWPGPPPAPGDVERSLRFRLDQQRDALAELDRILKLGDRMVALDKQLDDVGVHRLAWDNASSVGDVLEEIDRALIHLRADAASELVVKGERRVAPFLDLAEPPDWALAFSRAVRTRDVGGYALVRDRLLYLGSIRENLRWCRSVEDRLRPTLGSTLDSVRDPGLAVEWSRRAHHFGAAWRWAGAKAWLEQGEVEINRVVEELRVVDGRMRVALERLWELVSARVEAPAD